MFAEFFVVMFSSLCLSFLILFEIMLFSHIFFLLYFVLEGIQNFVLDILDGLSTLMLAIKFCFRIEKKLEVWPQKRFEERPSLKPNHLINKILSISMIK